MSKHRHKISFWISKSCDLLAQRPLVVTTEAQTMHFLGGSEHSVIMEATNVIQDGSLGTGTLGTGFETQNFEIAFRQRI